MHTHDNLEKEIRSILDELYEGSTTRILAMPRIMQLLVKHEGEILREYIPFAVMKGGIKMNLDYALEEAQYEILKECLDDLTKKEGEKE